MKKAVRRKIILGLILFVLLLVAGVFYRERLLRRQAEAAYLARNQVELCEILEKMWFISQETQYDILYKARAGAWDGTY